MAATKKAGDRQGSLEPAIGNMNRIGMTDPLQRHRRHPDR